MIKTISKVGNSQGVIFDAALMELANRQTGDELNVQVHAEGTITLAPVARGGGARHQIDVEGLRADDEEAGMSATPENCFHPGVDIVREIHAQAIARFGGSDGVRQ